MKIVAVYGSARKNGFSSLGVDYALDQFEGNEIKKYRLSDMKFGGCRGCFACRLNDGCVQKDDMTVLFQDIVSADFVIFSSPVYCFSLCGNYMKMFERLYPMLEGNKGTAGLPEKKTLRLPYSNRYPKVSCMLILAAGASALLCRSIRKCAENNFRHNGFSHLGTVVIDGTYSKKEKLLTEKQKQKIAAICAKVKEQ